MSYCSLASGPEGIGPKMTSELFTQDHNNLLGGLGGTKMTCVVLLSYKLRFRSHLKAFKYYILSVCGAWLPNKFVINPQPVNSGHLRVKSM